MFNGWKKGGAPGLVDKPRAKMLANTMSELVCAFRRIDAKLTSRSPGESPSIIARQKTERMKLAKQIAELSESQRLNTLQITNLLNLPDSILLKIFEKSHVVLSQLCVETNRIVGDHKIDTFDELVKDILNEKCIIKMSSYEENEHEHSTRHLSIRPNVTPPCTYYIIPNL